MNIMHKIDKFVGTYPRTVFICGVTLFILMLLFNCVSCQSVYHESDMGLRTQIEKEMHWAGLEIEPIGGAFFKYTAIIDNDCYYTGTLKYLDGKTTVISKEKLK